MKCKCDEERPRYTHTLIVQRPISNPDPDGNTDRSDDDNWEDLGKIRGRFITKGGRESRIFNQVLAVTTAVIRAPYSNLTATMDPSWRLKWGSRIFNITTAYHINEIGREVQIETTERRQP